MYRYATLIYMLPIPLKIAFSTLWEYLKWRGKYQEWKYVFLH